MKSANKGLMTLVIFFWCFSTCTAGEKGFWKEAPPSPVNNPLTKSEMVNQVRDGIVSIETSVAMTSVYRPFKSPTESAITGSGFFINDQGYLLTNAHVIGGVRAVDKALMRIDPAQIYVSTQKAGYERFETDLVAIFEAGDVALLKLREKEKFLEYHDNTITYLPLSNSDDLQVGEEILALGYPLKKQNLTVTEGIISGFTKNVRAKYQSIQTNSAINRGNSGGPSLDKNGGVIGINSAVERRAQNMNYVIPINMVKVILPTLLDLGKVHFPSMDMWWEFNSEHTAKYLKGPENRGVVIQYIIPDGTADRAGLQRLDILTKLGDIDIDFYGIGSKTDAGGLKKQIEPFGSYINRYRPEQAVTIEYYREGMHKQKPITLDAPVRLPIDYTKLEDETDYEIWGGMVIQPLTMNIVNWAKIPEIYDITHRFSPKVVITHVFRDSQADKTRLIQNNQIIYRLNDRDIKTLEDVRRVISNLDSRRYLSLELSQRVFAALDTEAVRQDEPQLKLKYKYAQNRPTK